MRDGHARTPPERPEDSGWTATTRESPDAIKGAKLGVAHIEHLIEHWPELSVDFADGRPQSAWEWDEDRQKPRIPAYHRQL